MPEFKVTTERLVEADTPQEAAALSARTRPDEWVVYSDDYRVVTVVTLAELFEAQYSPDDQADREEIVDAEIITDDDDFLSPGHMAALGVQTFDVPEVVQVQSYPVGRTFSSGETFTVEIDEGEFT